VSWFDAKKAKDLNLISLDHLVEDGAELGQVQAAQQRDGR